MRKILLLFIVISMALSTASTAQNWRTFDKNALPEPVCDAYPEFTELYYQAWQIAWSHITEQDGMPQTPFIDEAFTKDNDWIWDTNFMLLYWKYAHKSYAWIETLNNFYRPMHDGAPTSGRIHILDNPPLFAWTEYDYFKFSGDKTHLRKLLYDHRYLQKHFEWFDTVQPGTRCAGSVETCLKYIKDKGYLWEGGRSGMDNTPRGRTEAPCKVDRPNNKNMLWVDAIAQQALSAQYIGRLFEQLGDKKAAKEWNNTFEKIKKTINALYWDSEDGFYYDVNQQDMSLFKVATPASYWPMLAGVASKEQAAQLAEKAADPQWFGAKVPMTTLRPSDPDFSDVGNYWRGSMWLPTAYMSIKALDRYGYGEVSHALSVRIIEHMYQTMKSFEPHTIWESYSPTEFKPSWRFDEGGYVRKDFCGWSGLGPISLYIEDVLGFYDVDAGLNRVCWNRVLDGRHGIRRLSFGGVTADIIWTGDCVEVSSDGAFTLVVNGVSHDVRRGFSRL